MKHLILGGACSGKSHYAEQQAQADSNQQRLYYVATATVEGDSEMSERISCHRRRRGRQWQLIEESLDLAAVVVAHNTDAHCLLIDCLTLWVTNALIQCDWPERKQQFIQALQQSRANIFMVSNEVGLGVLPMGELTRHFVDETGRLHQELAAICERVTMVIAGLPQHLK